LGITLLKLIKYRAAIICCLLIITIRSSAQNIPKKTFWVCGDSKVLLVDYDASKGDVPSTIWSWDSKAANDIPKGFETKFNTLDDCKTYGDEVLISASSGAIAIVGIKDRKIHFYADVPLAHSVEMLPGGLLAAAASTHVKGNRIFLFDIKKSNISIYSDTLYSAHGVVWDDARKSLFAIGYTVLREYKLNATKNGLVLKNEWKIPGNGGHDLQMAPDKDHLFFTSETGNGEFDLKQSKFISMIGFAEIPNVKSIGQNNAGQFIYTIPEESWWTYHVKFASPQRIFNFPDLKVYKARWYQQ
jgi:hypothetical protein